MPAAVALLVALAQAEAGGPQRSWPPPEAPVLAAAARGAALQLLTEEVRQTGAVACILLEREGTARAPGEAFLDRLRKLPFVRGGEACEVRDEGVFESAGGAPAFLITVGPIEWIAPDEGHVRVVYRREGSSSRQRLYRVVRERTGWVSLGQILEMSPG